MVVYNVPTTLCTNIQPWISNELLCISVYREGFPQVYNHMWLKGGNSTIVLSPTGWASHSMLILLD